MQVVQQLPLEQTPLIPAEFVQGCPLTFVLGWPVSTHTDVPVEQLVLPKSQLFVGGVHGTLAWQKTQPPLSQTWFIPHDVPFGRLPVALHTGTPVLQEIEPVLQAAGVQVAPFVHALHDPLSQTALVPQLVPLATCDPVSVHTGVPLEHESVPVSHTLLGVQAVPFWHMVHAPLSQTMLVPQLVPLSTLLPVSLQTGAPDEQSMDPLWHGLDGTHELPWAHAAHVPLSQTMPLPQPVPFATLVP